MRLYTLSIIMFDKDLSGILIERKDMRERTRKSIMNITLSGLFIALGIVLPMALHAIPDGGKVFLPMFIPVLLGALYLSWPYAIAVGILTPLLSSLLTGMPPVAPLPMAFMMAAQLGVAALIVSLMKNIKWFSDKRYMVVLALIPALLAGFGISGLVLKIAIEFFGIKGPNAWTFIVGSVVSGLPGIAIQIVLIPLLYSLITKRRPTEGA